MLVQEICSVCGALASTSRDLSFVLPDCQAHVRVSLLKTAVLCGSWAPPTYPRPKEGRSQANPSAKAA